MGHRGGMPSQTHRPGQALKQAKRSAETAMTKRGGKSKLLLVPEPSRAFTKATRQELLEEEKSLRNPRSDGNHTFVVPGWLTRQVLTSM